MPFFRSLVSVFHTHFCPHTCVQLSTSRTLSFFFLDARRTLAQRWKKSAWRLWPFLVLCDPERGKTEGKGKDGCKHSWLLKGEIYSWVIKVYDWILSAIGCSWPRGARSMNMNFMLLSIPWSFPCISSRLSYGALKRLFHSLLLLDYSKSRMVS